MFSFFCGGEGPFLDVGLPVPFCFYLGNSALTPNTRWDVEQRNALCGRGVFLHHAKASLDRAFGRAFHVRAGGCLRGSEIGRSGGFFYTSLFVRWLSCEWMWRRWPAVASEKAATASAEV